MKIKIVSDGTPCGTKVTTVTGEEIEGVTSIIWRIKTDRIAYAQITFIGASVELDVDLPDQKD